MKEWFRPVGVLALALIVFATGVCCGMFHSVKTARPSYEDGIFYIDFDGEVFAYN